MKRKQVVLVVGLAVSLGVLYAGYSVFVLVHRSLMDAALLEAAARGDTATIIRCLRHGASANARDSQAAGGSTALIYACESGQPSAVKALLAYGADVGGRDNWGFTALHSAVGSHNLTMVRMLLARGADVNARNDDGFTPLILAAIHGDNDIVQALLGAGADVNAREHLFHYTALHHAYNELLRVKKQHASLYEPTLARTVAILRKAGGRL